MQSLNELIIYLQNFSTPLLSSIKIITLVSFVVFVIFCLAHLFAVGAKAPHLKNIEGQFFRHKPLSILPAALGYFCFFVVSIVAIMFIFGITSYKTLDFYNLYKLYSAALVSYFVIKVFSLIITFKENLFSANDKEWFSSLGHNFAKGKIFVSKEKINTGEKIYFWLTALFSLLYGISGIVLFNGLESLPADSSFANLLGFHALLFLLLFYTTFLFMYFMKFVYPGSLGQMFHGMVSRDWLATYHPDWYKVRLEEIRKEKEAAIFEEKEKRRMEAEELAMRQAMRRQIKVVEDGKTDSGK